MRGKGSGGPSGSQLHSRCAGVSPLPPARPLPPHPGRLLPKFTPGRAFLWGTVLALWGTGAVVATAARQLDIRTAEDAPGVLRPLFGGMGAALEAWFAPLRASMSINAVAGETLRTDTQQSELVRRLRTTLFTGSA